MFSPRFLAPPFPKLLQAPCRQTIGDADGDSSVQDTRVFFLRTQCSCSAHSCIQEANSLSGHAGKLQQYPNLRIRWHWHCSTPSASPQTQDAPGGLSLGSTEACMCGGASSALAYPVKPRRLHWGFSSQPKTAHGVGTHASLGGMPRGRWSGGWYLHSQIAALVPK